MRKWLAIVVLAVLACGDDGSSFPIDASVFDAGRFDATPIDGGADTTPTQEEGQFCETNDTGGPYCLESLTCCLDKICRNDCDTGGGIACESKSECPGGNVCCDLETMQMCTTKKACTDFGGTEIP